MTAVNLLSAAAFLAFSMAPAVATAQQAATPAARSDTAAAPPRGRATTDPERRAQLARRGGGLRAGVWAVRGDEAPAGVNVSETPALEGYLRKGLDAHLALENSIGFWRRRHTTTSSGGLIGSGTTRSTLDSYIVPQFTSLVFYPFTGPERALEPYVRGGIGFTVGIQDGSGEDGSFFVGGSGTSFVPGFGATGGAGVEWRPAEALGLGASARYQWIRFFQELGGERTFQGLGAELGVTYRFQFR